MTSIILLIHIALASTALLFAGVTAFGTLKRNQNNADHSSKNMWLFTALGVVTGFILSLAVHAPLTQACVSSLALISVVTASQLYKTYAFAKS